MSFIYFNMMVSIYSERTTPPSVKVVIENTSYNTDDWMHLETATFLFQREKEHEKESEKEREKEREKEKGITENTSLVRHATGWRVIEENKDATFD